MNTGGFILMDRILFLDNSIKNDLYRPLSYWEPLLLFDFDTYRASDGELPDDLDGYSHVFISGSTASVLDNSDWILAEQKFIRAAVDQGKVIVGSCFGHQIIARALFGDGAVRKRPALDVGWPEIEILADDALLGEAGSKIHGYVFHYDEVCEVDKSRAAVIARSDACEILAFKLKDRPVWGIQPHFEMGIVEGLKFVELVKGDGVPERQSFLNSTEKLPKDSGWIIPLMKAYHQIRPL
jgi:GMP synthase-like glutamine amidotransferase